MQGVFDSQTIRCTLSGSTEIFKANLKIIPHSKKEQEKNRQMGGRNAGVIMYMFMHNVFLCSIFLVVEHGFRLFVCFFFFSRFRINVVFLLSAIFVAHLNLSNRVTCTKQPCVFNSL